MAKAKVKAKTPAAPRRAPAKAAFKPHVVVRMYMQGLGDCFLLRFHEAADRTFDVLIDCGIYKASPDADRLMNEVVDDIVETTGNRLDLLVVTHEHWDHISGFDQALDKFKDMDVAQVWQAWTDDETEPVAKELKRRFRRAKTKLVGMLRNAEARQGAAGSPALDRAFETMRFFGFDREAGPAADVKTEDAFTRIAKMLAAKNQKFLSPGAVEPVGDTGVKAFVLGPPKDADAIAKDDPGKKDGYHKQQAAFLDRFETMLGASGVTGVPLEDKMNRPFAPAHEIPYETARQYEFFQTLYPFDAGSREGERSCHPEDFRSIDDLPLEALGGLALRLDSHINNTSLVLAFRLPSGKVLLFPGDAQGGNWKSWADLAKPLAFKEHATDAHKLLADTVLYKVAHHGSHNATPRTYGLELMKRKDLTALVPVDHEIAFGAGYGEMPLVSIIDALKAREGGVFRSDDDPKAAAKKGFRFSDKKLKIRTRKDGDSFTRPLFCEVEYELD